MNISFDATANINNVGTPGTTLSGSHTMGTGNSGIVWVFVTANASATVSSLTYGGVAMTASVNAAYSTARLRAYYLLNPPSGSNTVSITVSTSATIIMFVSSYFNVHWYDVINTSAIAENATGGTELATSVITTKNNCWCVGFARTNGTPTLGGSGYTQRLIQSTIILADTNGAITPAGTSTMTTTYTPSGSVNSHILIALTPVQDTPVSGFFM